MSEENKTVESSDEEFEKVSGGGKIYGEDFQVGDWVRNVSAAVGSAPIYYHVNAINGLTFDGTGYMQQMIDKQVICVGNATLQKVHFYKPASLPPWLPEL